jgi:hypothetical protein
LWLKRSGRRVKAEGDKMKLYKVLKHIDGKLVSPFQEYEYKPGRGYICVDFDPNPAEDCSRGYYATDIDGIIYSFRNLPGYEVWEVEVGGKSVEVDQFKRRYERITLLRQIPLEEVRTLAEAEEEKIGYKLSEALFPVNPLKIEAGPVTDEEIELLKKWASLIRNSVWVSIRDSIWDSICDSILNSVSDSILNSVSDSIWVSVCDSILDSVCDSILNSVCDSIRDSVCDSIRDSIWDSVRDSAEAYISSFYPGIKTWKHFDHPEGENPFQPAITLWHKGFVPSFDGKTWRLHAGEEAKVVWERSLTPEP